MCKVIICANQKGGVAKSTSVVNLGIGLANKGKRVLVIDNDPQGSLTEALGYPQPDKLEITLANVMEWVLNEDDYDLKAGILHHEEGIDLMPANIELSGVETSLVGIMSSETTLREYIESVRDDYDYILVDCSPNLGQLTLNALVAAGYADAERTECSRQRNHSGAGGILAYKGLRTAVKDHQSCEA